MAYVEIGFMIANKTVIEEISDNTNDSFSRTLTKLSNSGRVSGVVGLDSYYSISDLERLEIIRNFLKPKKIILIDRDGTINVKSKKGFYITTAEQVEYIQDSVEGLKLLAKNGYEFIIITNQAGISTGDLTEENLTLIHQKIKQDLLEMGITVLDIYCSTAHWQDLENFSRKPHPGMFFQASKDHKIPLANTYYIGDDPRDLVAASNANTVGLFYGDIQSLKDDKVKKLCSFSSMNMVEISQYILKKSRGIF
jgi:histidinol-phosphate phosphatase family protein